MKTALIPDLSWLFSDDNALFLYLNKIVFQE